MTPSQRVHLTCLLRFPVYRYLYPLTRENSSGFTRLALPGGGLQSEAGRWGVRKTKCTRNTKSPSLAPSGAWEVSQAAHRFESYTDKRDEFLKTCSGS